MNTIDMIDLLLSNDDNNLLCSKSIDNNINLKNIIFNDLEKITQFKLYNKLELVKILNDNFLPTSENIKIIQNFISLNLIPNIKFDKLFNSNLNLSIVFKNNDVCIYYKNKKINLENINDNIININEYINSINEINDDKYLISSKLNIMKYVQKYLNNIITVITKFIEKDLLVKYHCSDIPIEYWNLFQIKCNKSKKNINISKEYQDLIDIINGEKYKIDISKIDISKIDIYNDLDTKHICEVVSYLNDEDTITFFNIHDKIKKIITEIDDINFNLTDDELNNKIKEIVNFNKSNTMISLYSINILYKILINCYITRNHNFINKFYTIIENKINEFRNQINSFKSAELSLFSDIEDTFIKIIKIISYIKNKNII